MSPHLEFEDKTVEKAVGKACEELNVPREKLKYDVISYGSTGIFGLVGIKKARIRVTHLPPNKTAETEDREASAGSEPRDSANEIPVAADDSDSEACSPVSEDVEPISAEDAEPVSEDIEDDEEDAYEGFYDDEDIESDAGDDVVSPESLSSPPASEPRSGCEDEEVKSGEIAASLELGKTALQRIVDFITADASISIKTHSERITFQIQGGNTAVLIGKRGQTLEAIQYIVEKIVNKNHPERIRIQVDIEGYLDSRRARLESLAARLSEKAKRIGKPITIGQLNAHDRRIVHIALKDDTGVRTQSMGEGFYRKLVIFPLKSRSRKKEHF